MTGETDSSVIERIIKNETLEDYQGFLKKREGTIVVYSADNNNSEYKRLRKDMDEGKLNNTLKRNDIYLSLISGNDEEILNHVRGLQLRDNHLPKIVVYTLDHIAGVISEYFDPESLKEEVTRIYSRGEANTNILEPKYPKLFTKDLYRQPMRGL